MTNPYYRPIPFQQVIDALLDEKRPFPAKLLHRFSDIEREDLAALTSIWSQIPANRRANLMEDLEMQMETDTLMSYDALARFALNDDDSRVRIRAMRLLWETQDAKLVPAVISLMEDDENILVRSMAANLLGQYVYWGEVEEIPAPVLHQVEDSLIAAAAEREDDELARRALESLGYSSRDEVPELIESAYESDDPDWLASALFAMGRSADQVWEQEVLEMIDHPESQVQLEAIRAAGNLELSSAREILLEFLVEGIEDEDIRAATIWSLSQIGGENVQETLDELLESSEDDEEAEFIEQAMENLVLTDGFDKFNMFEFGEGLDRREVDDLPELDSDDDEGNVPRRSGR